MLHQKKPLSQLEITDKEEGINLILYFLLLLLNSLPLPEGCFVLGYTILFYIFVIFKLLKMNIMEKNISGIRIICRQGDIAAQEDCEAVVNAANAQLTTGGGVAGAIHRAAGPELAKEAHPLAPIKPGQAVITKGYNLPNKYVIHCLGPVYGKDTPEGILLSKCYSNALHLAEKNNIESIAFPAISTGIFGYPVEEAASVAFDTILDRVSELKKVRKIVFVLHSSKDLDIHQNTLERKSKDLT